MELFEKPNTFVDTLFEVTAGNLGVATQAVGAPAERILDGLEYYGVIRKAGEVVVDLLGLRAKKIRPRRRLLQFA